MELVYSEFFDEKTETSYFGDATGNFTEDYQLTVETQTPNSGCFFEVPFNSGETYSLQLMVTLNQGSSVIVKVVDPDFQTLSTQTVEQSGNVLLNFTPQTIGTHQIILMNHESEPNIVFTIDNLYVYFIPQNENDFVTLFKPDVLAYNDYYPFGMLVPNRHSSSDAYRYGFNGKEKDDEVKGEGAQYDYGFRIYDPRVSRFLSLDPLFKSYPWFTPYQFAGNSPIWAIDLDGLESKIVILQTDYYPIVH